MQEIELVSFPLANVPVVSIREAKLQDRVPVTVTIEDDLHTVYVNAAEKLVESMAEITLRSKTFDINRSDFGETRCFSAGEFQLLRIEIPPVSEVTYIKYYDSTDTLQTLDESDYELWLSHSPPMIVIPVENIPDLSTTRLKSVTIRVVAGETGNIPALARLAIIELAAFWFQNREAFGRSPSPNDGAQGRVFYSLIDALRWRCYP